MNRAPSTHRDCGKNGQNQVALNDVTCVTCAGNTTMTHFLLGVDPTYIRREPYVSTANFFPVVRAAEAGIRINRRRGPLGHLLFNA